MCFITELALLGKMIYIPTSWEGDVSTTLVGHFVKKGAGVVQIIGWTDNPILNVLYLSILRFEPSAPFSNNFFVLFIVKEFTRTQFINNII